MHDRDDSEVILCSLEDVGSRKSVGYLPLYTIERFIKGYTLEILQTRYSERGLYSEVFGPDKAVIKSGAFFVYDREMMQQVIAKHVDAINAEAWPLDAQLIIHRIASQWLDTDHPLMPFVNELFADSA